MRIISQRAQILSTACLVLAISFLGLGAKLVFAPVSFHIQSDALLLRSLSGVLFALATYALYRAFQIGLIRLIAPIIGGCPVFSILCAAFLGIEIHLTDWFAVMVVLGGVTFVSHYSGSVAETSTNFEQALIWSGVSSIGLVCRLQLVRLQYLSVISGC